MASTGSPAAATPALKDYVRPVWVRRWFVLAMVVIAAAAVYVYYARQDDVFEANTAIFVQPTTDSPDVPAVVGDRNTANQAALLQSRQVAAKVAGDIGYAGDPANLLRQIAVTGSTGSDFIQITAKGADPQVAANLANGFARAFIEIRTSNRRSALTKSLQALQTQLAQLPKGSVNAAARTTLEDNIRQLQLALSTPPGDARQVDKALPPAHRASPRPLRNAVFAGILALVLAIGLAFGLERFDRRVKKPEDVADLYGAPLLAVLPHVRESSVFADGQATLGAEFKESFRALRTNIQLGMLDAPKGRILVTSAIPGEGKSTVVRNLAVAYREGGFSVAVVEADLRRPTLARLFGVEPGVGLTEILVGESDIGRAAREISVEVPGAGDIALLRADAPTGTPSVNGGGDVGHLTLLTSGKPPANPPAILAAQGVQVLIDQLADTHDIVLLDSPPLLAVTDTVALLSRVDAVVFVARLGVTTADNARELMSLVRRANGADVVGVVANDRSQLDAMAAYDYYGTGYSDGNG